MAGPFIIFFSYLILSTVMTGISVNALRNHLKVEVIPIRSQSASHNPSNTLKDRIRATIALPLSDNNFPGSDGKYDAIFKRENIPLIGIAVGIIAFSFQLSVLYPWHVELHSSFNTLETLAESNAGKESKMENEFNELIKESSDILEEIKRSSQ